MTTPTVVERQDEVYRQLRRVIDPELGMSIVKLGLVYDIRIADDTVVIEVTMTTRGCPLQHAITAGIRKVVSELPWVSDLDVRVVWEPPWHPGMIR